MLINTIPAISYYPFGMDNCSWNTFQLVRCDVCTGGLVWSHNFEDTDLTKGSPCGCTASGTASKDLTYYSTCALSTTLKSNGSKSLYWPTGGSARYAQAAMDSSTVSVSQGTVWLDWYPSTFVNGGRIFQIRYDNSNRIVLTMEGSSASLIRPRFYFTVGGASYSVQIQTGDEGATGNWYRLKCEWKQGGSPSDIKITMWDLDIGSGAVSNERSRAEKRNYSAMANQPSILNIGDFGNNNTSSYVDRFRIYTTSEL